MVDGEKVRAARAAAGLSRGKLATKLAESGSRMSVDTLKRLEGRKAGGDVGVAKVAAVARALGVDIGQLL